MSTFDEMLSGKIKPDNPYIKMDSITSFIAWNPYFSCFIVLALLVFVFLAINKAKRDEVKAKMKNFQINKTKVIYSYCILIILICAIVPYQLTTQTVKSGRIMHTNEYVGYHLISKPPVSTNDDNTTTEILYGRIALELVGATAIAGMLYAYEKDKESNK